MPLSSVHLVRVVGSISLLALMSAAFGDDGAREVGSRHALNARGVEDCPGEGDCCEANGTPSCDEPECCNIVCLVDPFCCDEEWDGICADAAQDRCAVCDGGGGEGPDCDGNDLCEDALVIHNGDTVTGETCGDCDSDGSPSCGLSQTNLDVWYTYTSDCPDSGAGEIHVETCGSVYDTVLSIHTDCPGNIDNQIVCNDDFCDLQSGVDFASMDGTTYVIRVSGFGDACGDFILTLTEECGCVDDGECDDDDPCTDDFCSAGVCQVPQIDCDDGDPCTDDACVGEGDCQNEDNGDCCPTPARCDGDANGDGLLDPLDAGYILARLGGDACAEDTCPADVNCDGLIDPLDVGYVLARFGVCDPPAACILLCLPDNLPGNDDCEDAFVIEDGLTPFSTDGATTDGECLPSECGKSWFCLSQDIWYQYTATCTGLTTVSACNDGDPETGEADFDTNFAAYTGCECPVDNDNIAGCNDDAPGCSGFTSILEFETINGACYSVRIGGFVGSGTGVLAVSCDE